jgi:hypothetical protein
MHFFFRYRTVSGMVNFLILPDSPNAECPCPLSTSTAHCPHPTEHCPLSVAHCSLPAHCRYSLFTVHCPCPLPITLSLVPTVHCILLTAMPAYCPWPTATVHCLCPLFTAYHPLPTLLCLLLTAHCPQPLFFSMVRFPLSTTHYSLSTVHYYCPLLIAHCPLPNTIATIIAHTHCPFPLPTAH